MMKTAILPFFFAWTLWGTLLLACGDDDEEAPPEPVPQVSTGTVSGIGDEAIDEAACQSFCEKANECAAAAGRVIPPDARDCAASCRPGGVHRQAPAAIHACAEEACGTAFTDCTRRAMLSHMSGRDVAVFPPICQGLCEKAARCNRRGGLPLGPGEEDCEAACVSGGIYADVPEHELLCVHQPCGPPFTTCREAGGPSGPPEILPPPTSP